MALCIEELEATGDVEPEECTMEAMEAEKQNTQADQGKMNADQAQITKPPKAADQRQTKRKRRPGQGQKTG
jgi:hypothetical protein